MFSLPELGSDPPNGSSRESGRDTRCTSGICGIVLEGSTSGIVPSGNTDALLGA